MRTDRFQFSLLYNHAEFPSKIMYITLQNLRCKDEELTTHQSESKNKPKIRSFLNNVNIVSQFEQLIN